MTMVDSSVWIDYFRGKSTPQTNVLDYLLGNELLVVGDLILLEVLQGFNEGKQLQQADKLMRSMEVIELGGEDVALLAAQHFRTLRAKGITVRKTIDTLIATRCILDGLPLLFSDRDFDPFVAHLGLRSRMQEAGLAEASGAKFSVHQTEAICQVPPLLREKEEGELKIK